MTIAAMYTTTRKRLVGVNNLGLLGLVALLLVVGVRLVPLGFIRLLTLVILVTLVPFSIIIFL